MNMRWTPREGFNLSCRLIAGFLFANVLFAGEGAPAAGSLHNKDAVFFTRFLEMTPNGAVTAEPQLNKWRCRTDAKFMAKDDNVLQLGPGDDMPDLSYDPHLKGRFNLYIGLRGVDAPTGVQIQASGMDQWATVELPTHPKTHENHDILWATGVEMDGRAITIHPYLFTLYLDYLSFVPTEKDANAKVDPQFVKYGPRCVDGPSPSAAKCVERFYRDERPMPPTSDRSKARGYVLFRTHWMDLIFPNTMPAEDAGQIVLECRATPGEFEPVAFAIHPLEDLEGIRVALAGPLRSQRGEIAPENVDIRVTRYLNKRWTGYVGAVEYMCAPMYLESMAEHTVKKGTTQQYWLTVHAPDDAQSGLYEGQVLFTAKGRPTEVIPFRLTVYSFRLSPLTGHNVGMYYASSCATPPLEAFQDMKQHGMNSVGWFGESGIEVTGQFPNIEVNVEGSALAKTMEAFRANGLDGDFLWGIHGDPFERFCAKLLPDEKAFADAYVAIVRQILDEGRKRHWPRLLIQVADEAPSNPSVFPTIIREMPLLKQAGAVTEQDHLWLKTNRGPAIQENIDKCVSSIDIFTLRFSGRPIFYVDTWEEITRRVLADKKTLFTYNINNGMAFPEMATMRFSAGWFFHTVGTGCSGYYLWAYQYARGSSYNDFDSPTDWVQQYPPSKKLNTSGGPALYWEALREGVDDLKYIATLERLLEQRKGDASAEVGEARKALADLAASFDIAKMESECRFLECRWAKTETLPDGRRVADGPFNLPNGWSFERYDEARGAVADAIARLVQKP